jgi:hypothetical protein
MEEENWRYDRILYCGRWKTGRGRQSKGKGQPGTGYEAPNGSILEENVKMEFTEVMFASIRKIQGDSFGTGHKKMLISQRLFIRFRTCIYNYIPCFMRSMSILEEILEIFIYSSHICMFKI